MMRRLVVILLLAPVVWLARDHIPPLLEPDCAEGACKTTSTTTTTTTTTAAATTTTTLVVQNLGSPETFNDENSGSTSITVPANTTVIVVAIGCHKNATTNWYPANPVSIGGTNLTTVQKTDDQSTTGQGWIGYIVNPGTGSKTIAYNMGETCQYGGAYSVSYYSGVNTSDPITSSTKQTTDNVDCTGLSAASEDMMVGAAFNNGATSPTVTDNSQTQILSTNYRSVGLGTAYKAAATGFYYSNPYYGACAALVLNAN